MRVTFIRHAESQSNLDGRWQGQSNSPLSKGGRLQARALALRLAGQKFDLVLASDLDRTQETARALERPIELSPAWREIDVGSWEGLTHGQVATRFPEQIAALAGGSFDTPIGGGESWVDMRARARTAFDALVSRLGENDHALVVSHGGVLATLAADWLGVFGVHPRPLGRMTNTALLEIEIDGDPSTPGAFRVTAYNDASHLSPYGPVVAERLDNKSAVLALLSARGGAGDSAYDESFRAFHKEARERYGPDALARAEALAALIEKHRGEVFTVAHTPAEVAAETARLVGLPAAARAQLAAADPGAYAHLIVSSARCSLAEYNLRAHLKR